jgi:hypothetical protein
MAINAMQKEGSKGSLRGKFNRAGWDDGYLYRLMELAIARLIERNGAGLQLRIVEQQDHIVKQRALIALQSRCVVAFWSMICPAMTRWQLIAAAVTIVPFRASIS